MRKDRRSFVLLLSWKENHVVPAVLLSNVRAIDALGVVLLSVINLMSCCFNMLQRFGWCVFWVVLICLCGYSCTRLACFDPTRGLWWDHFLPMPGDISWCRARWSLGANTDCPSLALCLFPGVIFLFFRADCAFGPAG